MVVFLRDFTQVGDSRWAVKGPPPSSGGPREKCSLSPGMLMADLTGGAPRFDRPTFLKEANPFSPGPQSRKTPLLPLFLDGRIFFPPDRPVYAQVRLPSSLLVSFGQKTCFFLSSPRGPGCMRAGSVFEEDVCQAQRTGESCLLPLEGDPRLYSVILSL